MGSFLPFLGPDCSRLGLPTGPDSPLPDPQLLLGPWPHCLSGPACWGCVYLLSVFLGVDKQTEDKLEGEERRPGRWTKGDPAHHTPPPFVYLLFLNSCLPSPGTRTLAHVAFQKPPISALGSSWAQPCCWRHAP